MEERDAPLAPRRLPITGEPAVEPTTGIGEPRVPIRLATMIIACLVIGYLATTLVLVAAAGLGLPYVLLALVTLVMLLGLQANHCLSKYRTYAGQQRSRRWWLTFLAQVVLTYAPFAWFGESWLRIPGLLAGSALLLLPLPWRWGGYATVVAAQAGLGWLFQLDLAGLLEQVVVTAVAGLVVYGVVRLAGLAYQLQLTRSRLARIAVTDEQERFRRDLHDLLGHRLMAVSLKSELAKRLLVERDLHKAEDQLIEAIDAVRQAQSDVRAVAYGYAAGSLEHELAQVRSTLEAAGVHCRIELSDGFTVEGLSPTLDVVLAAVLHEGVTNVLRHSFAQLCEIELGQDGEDLRLTVVNDGVRHEPHRRAAGGAGIQGMIERTAAVGGRLSADPEGGGRFRLAARIPLVERTASPADPAEREIEG